MYNGYEYFLNKSSAILHPQNPIQEFKHSWNVPTEFI